MAWNKNGQERDKAAEKAVKTRLGNTHLKSVRIIGSEKDPEFTGPGSNAQTEALDHIQ